MKCEETCWVEEAVARLILDRVVLTLGDRGIGRGSSRSLYRCGLTHRLRQAIRTRQTTVASAIVEARRSTTVECLKAALIETRVPSGL